MNQVLSPTAEIREQTRPSSRLQTRCSRSRWLVYSSFSYWAFPEIISPPNATKFCPWEKQEGNNRNRMHSCCVRRQIHLIYSLLWRAQRSWCTGMKEHRPTPNTGAKGRGEIGKKEKSHKTCACTCEHCPTFWTGKHILQMGTRCRRELLVWVCGGGCLNNTRRRDAARRRRRQLPHVASTLLEVSVANSCARNLIFLSQNKTIIFRRPPPTWIRLNSSPQRCN